MERIVAAVMRLFRRERWEIGRPGPGPYLTRWTLWGRRFAGTPRHNVYLHLFHRGDAEPYFHDHPWPFWSLILCGGYWEWTTTGAKAGAGPYRETRDGAGRILLERAQWYGPFSLLRRPAEWRHRVELPPGKKCWTLVWCGPKVRSWGFWCPKTGFLPWREHERRQEAGLPGCE